MSCNPFSSAPIAEMFTSIDGEVNHCGQGTLSHFIRVAGCNLKCSWCDTKSTQKAEGFAVHRSDRLVYHLMDSIPQGVEKITITGGEPLLYPSFLEEVVGILSARGFEISVETNGSIKIMNKLNCSWVMDIKPPSSGHEGCFCYHNLDLMNKQKDWLKLVIVTQDDLAWAVEETNYVCSKVGRCNIAWSLSGDGDVTPSHAITTLLDSGMGFVKINAQLHKYLKLK